jgi:hypothetical protein
MVLQSFYGEQYRGIRILLQFCELPFSSNGSHVIGASLFHKAPILDDDRGQHSLGMPGTGRREVVFGYPGGAILPAYDALKHSKIHHVLVRHEQGATHMADGYARASGEVGVAVATSGPGATNMVTGIATAMLDSIPIVCITGQVGSKLIGSDAFQETDITGVTLPITKHNYLVTHAAKWRARSAKLSTWQVGAAGSGAGRYH